MAGTLAGVLLLPAVPEWSIARLTAVASDLGRPAASTQTTALEDPDALYALRQDPARASRAASAWAERVARMPRDFEAAWKLARARYWLGGHVAHTGRRQEFRAGMEAARAAIAARPDRPEGHFWLAANMGGLAEVSGLMAGLRYRGRIKAELEIVLRIDPAFQQGSADRALGRWYSKVPALFGGSKRKAEEHLRRSLAHNSTSTVSLFFLAETLLAMDREGEARVVLQQVLDAPLDPEWAPEDLEFKEKARELLQRITRKDQ